MQPADRLFDLIDSFSSLRQNNRILVDQIRGSLDRLRELRRELSQRKPPGPTGQFTGAGEGVVASHFGLTPREEEVALLLARGKSNQAIARELKISVHTARHHTQRILDKLEVHSRGEAGAKIRADS
jgi:DNA-binding CsgD family transcriptional regulator